MPENEQKTRQIWYGGRKPGWLKIQTSKLFSLLVLFRLKLYALGLLKTKKLKIPVFVVGNITAGGG
ncbi:MAG: tetraacyldisaccharide 4'-kinase, partial [Proteobacteria bacterium]|nr:tetraacyldisaccharide 4'-kinase [Pseudomonadota bacterium]